MVGHWDSVFAEVLLLVELVLDCADSLPAGLDPHLRRNLLEGVGVDMLNFRGDDIAGLGQLTDGFALLERSGHMAVVGTDLLGGRVLDVEHVGLDVQSVGGLDEHAAQLAATEDSNLGRVPHNVGSEEYMTQLLRICKTRDRRCPSAPKIRGESRDTIDKLGPITVVTATVPCRSFDLATSHFSCTADLTMSLGEFPIVVAVYELLYFQSANTDILDEEALQTAANGGSIELYVTI